MPRVVFHLARLFALLAATPAFADTLHLLNGGAIEGVLIEKTESVYRIRTFVGVLAIPLDSVARLERGVSLIEAYETQRDAAPSTPAGWSELADWCMERDLKVQAHQHWEAALVLDPNYEPARRGLGFVLVNGLWVDGRQVSSRPAAAPDNNEEDEKLISAIQGQWYLRILSIRRNQLESSDDRLSRDARRKLLEIRDPLAIHPMTRALSEGRLASRRTLVAALVGFEQDEATLNLAAVAMLDEDAEVRRTALVELVRRNDPRVAAQFRKALQTGDDRLIRRAAIAVRMLADASSVPYLIPLLRVERRMNVEVPIPSYIASYDQTFGSTGVSLGPAKFVNYRPRLGFIGSTSVFPASRVETQDVTVFRTEVHEALRSITGQDFGFDVAAWRRWHEEQAP